MYLTIVTMYVVLQYTLLYFTIYTFIIVVDSLFQIISHERKGYENYDCFSYKNQLAVKRFLRL